MVVFKMRDSVPSARYSSVCNVLRLWRISLIPTYRVYGLYDTDFMIYIGRILHSSTISVVLAQARTMTFPGASGTVYSTKKWLSCADRDKEQKSCMSRTVPGQLATMARTPVAARMCVYTARKNYLLHNI